MMGTSRKPLVLRNPATVYFGKIVSRGDFVRSNSGTKLIALLDSWVAQGMESLIAEPDWKHRYDQRGLTDFLFLGTQKRQAVCGALIPSQDASSRRFPFLAATLFDTEDAMRFFPHSALVLERHMNHLRALLQLAAHTHDATAPLATLAQASSDPAWASAQERDGDNRYTHFLDATSLDGLAAMLGKTATATDIRQMVLALGYLLQPMRTRHATPPQKGIALPLPSDPAQATLVKSLWLDMIAPFLVHADFEISLFSFQQDHASTLAVTFNGVTPATFGILFGKQDDRLIDLAQSAWVEECVRRDTGMLKLSSYLEHGALPLRQLVDTFRQSFIG